MLIFQPANLESVMLKRRSFLKRTTLLGSMLGGWPLFSTLARQGLQAPGHATVISTWNHGIPANARAWQILAAGGTPVDAAEGGVRVVESDPDNSSVGIGGRPDRDGRVTLDASIMAPDGNCGAVAALEHIENPISVARKVMEDTPHVMLVGDGALQFALEQGFTKKNLLTEASRQAWQQWLKNAEYKPVINIENHDTIGLLVQDADGHIAGACTTSGLAYKMHGRVGDSPIIGAGLFVDDEVGGATATGMGEAVIKVAGSHTVVELMRQGYEPCEACREAVKRITRKEPRYKELQVGFLALRKDGLTGGFAIHQGFNYALMTAADNNRMVNADSLL